MLTYPALASWPKVKQKTTTMALNKTQCLACIGITGAMKSYTLIAPQTLLIITRLSIAKEKVACLSALTLSNSDKLKPGNLKIPDHWIANLVLSRLFRLIMPVISPWDGKAFKPEVKARK